MTCCFIELSCFFLTLSVLYNVFTQDWLDIMGISYASFYL